MTINSSLQYSRQKLQPVYEEKEAFQLAGMLLEHLTGLGRIDRILQKDQLLDQHQEKQLDTYLDQLLQSVPVQYIIGEAWFCGAKFQVNPDVLVPRPETEELVHWILQDIPTREQTAPVIIDIGTGSGCIAVSLKRALAHAKVYATDISGPALAVAKENACRLNAAIHYIQADILTAGSMPPLPRATVIVSNPPYIPYHDQGSVAANVLAHEPHLALFVPDEDPLLFYRAIGNFALQQLEPSGALYVEINETSGAAVCSLLAQCGFTTLTLRQDIYGKDRMIKAAIERL